MDHLEMDYLESDFHVYSDQTGRSPIFSTDDLKTILNTAAMGATKVGTYSPALELYGFKPAVTRGLKGRQTSFKLIAENSDIKTKREVYPLRSAPTTRFNSGSR